MIYKILSGLLFLSCLTTFALAQDLTPTETEAVLECIVADPERIPEEGAEVYIESADKVYTNKGKSDVDGKIKFLVPEGKKYNIRVRKFNKDFFFTDINVAAVDGGQELTQYLRIKLVKFYVRGYTLDHVYFDTNKWDIKPASLPTLEKLYQSFVKNPKLVVEIAGHTDHVGDDANNLRLSQLRADAIREYLIKKGISEGRVLAKGYGEKSPVAGNDTDAGRAKNRRTEVKVIEE
jgi:OmpA-OmpF porin, OOP family